MKMCDIEPPLQQRQPPGPNNRLCCLPACGTLCSEKPNGRAGQQQPTCSSLIHDLPFFPTALWPLPFGRESFGLGRREPLPHGWSCQRPPVPDPSEDENKADEHG